MLDLAQGKTIKQVKSEEETRALSSRRSAQRRSQQASQRSMNQDIPQESQGHESLTQEHIQHSSYDQTKDLFVPVQSK